MREKDSPPRPEHPKLEAVVDRAGAKFLSRYIVPLQLAALVAVSGYAFKITMERLDTLVSNDKDRAKDVDQIKSDVRDLNTRLDAGVIAQIKSNSEKLEDHEARIRDLERAQNVLRPPRNPK